MGPGVGFTRIFTRVRKFRVKTLEDKGGKFKIL